MISISHKVSIPTATTPIHTDNTRLFFIPRDGQIIKRPWNELTATEQESLLEAERRAEYVAMFGIYA